MYVNPLHLRIGVIVEFNDFVLLARSALIDRLEGIEFVDRYISAQIGEHVRLPD